MYYAIHSPYNVLCVLPYTPFVILIACSVTLHQRCLEVNGESLQQGQHLGELEGDNRGTWEHGNMIFEEQLNDSPEK